MKFDKLVAGLACASALCFALVGCGGAGNVPSVEKPAEEPAEEPAAPVVSDEDLIKKDFQKELDKVFSVEGLATELSKEEEMSALFDAFGMSADEYAELAYKLFIFETKDVKVEGDKATLTVSVTIPDWENAETVIQEVVEKKAAEMDTENMTEEDLQNLFAETMREVMAYPPMPSKTEEKEIAYVKKDDVWTMEDKDAIDSLVDVDMM